MEIGNILSLFNHSNALLGFTMKTSTIAFFLSAAAMVITAGIYVSHLVHRTSPTDAVISPAATVVADTSPTALPTSVPLGNKYESAAIGLSFQYPQGYYTVERAGTEVFVLNRPQLPSGPDYTVRSVTFIYGNKSAADEEAKTKAMAGVTEKNLTTEAGLKVRIYTFPDPTDASVNIDEAFFEGKNSFYLSFPWDLNGTTIEERSQYADDIFLLDKIVPTIGLAN